MRDYPTGYGDRRAWTGAELELLYLVLVEDGDYTEEWIKGHILEQQKFQDLCIACKSLLYAPINEPLRENVFKRQASGPVTIEGTRVIMELKDVG